VSFSRGGCRHPTGVNIVRDELAAHADDDFCYLTTRGRVTGHPHEIEIWFALGPASDGATLYLMSGGDDRSDWVRNLLAEHAVTVRIGTPRTRGVRA
jgi:hypothetical protein